MGRGKNLNSSLQLNSAEILFKHSFENVAYNRLEALPSFDEYVISNFTVASLAEKQKMQNELRDSLRKFLFKGFQNQEIKANREIRHICSALDFDINSFLAFLKSEDNSIYSPIAFEKFNLLNNILLKIKNLDIFNEGTEYLVATTDWWCDSKCILLGTDAVNASIIELYTQYGVINLEVWKKTDGWLKNLASVPSFFGTLHRPIPRFPIDESEFLQLKSSKELLSAIKDTEEILLPYDKSNHFVDVLRTKIRKQLKSKKI